MANAAAKKAAAAKIATANVYLPILLSSNILYILLLCYFTFIQPSFVHSNNNHQHDTDNINTNINTNINNPQSYIWNTRFVMGMLLAWSCQAWSYWGILDHAASSHKPSSSASSSSSTSSSQPLVGGAHLDLLGLTILIQYASLLHSPKWFYLFILIPIAMAWHFYYNVIAPPSTNTSKRYNNNNNNNNNSHNNHRTTTNIKRK